MRLTGKGVLCSSFLRLACRQDVQEQGSLLFLGEGVIMKPHFIVGAQLFGHLDTDRRTFRQNFKNKYGISSETRQ